jgi:hypothetical protein
MNVTGRAIGLPDQAVNSMFAFVDETGNTGANLLDAQQPDFFTAALITKSDFDLVYADHVRRIAKKVGAI